MIRIVLNYGILSGLIYAGIVYLDPGFMYNLGLFITGAVTSILANMNAPMGVIVPWWNWGLSWLPRDWSYWVKVLAPSAPFTWPCMPF